MPEHQLLEGWILQFIQLKKTARSACAIYVFVFIIKNDDPQGPLVLQHNAQEGFK